MLQLNPTTSGISLLLPKAETERGQGVNDKDIVRVQVGFNWHGFIAIVYNSGDQNVLTNDWYAYFHVLSKWFYVWNAYLSLLDDNLVIAGLQLPYNPAFFFDLPTHWGKNAFI